MKIFTGVVAITVGILAGGALLLGRMPSFGWITLSSLGISTIGIYFLLFRLPGEKLLQYFLLSLVLKLLVFAGYAIFLIRADPAEAEANVVFFLLVYAVLTLLESLFLARKRG